MKCVVGNCLQPDEDVKRCYWSKEVGLIRGAIESHAYLDLCSFHQTILCSYSHSYQVQGWDAIND